MGDEGNNEANRDDSSSGILTTDYSRLGTSSNLFQNMSISLITPTTGPFNQPLGLPPSHARPPNSACKKLLVQASIPACSPLAEKTPKAMES